MTLNFNLFNGGATRRAIQQAEIQVEMAGLERDRIEAEGRSALAQAWDRRLTAAAIHGMAAQRTKNARLAAEIGAGRYRDGALNAIDFRALDVAVLQAEAAELAAQQEWGAAHWEVMRLAGGLRAGDIQGDALSGVHSRSAALRVGGSALRAPYCMVAEDVALRGSTSPQKQRARRRAVPKWSKGRTRRTEPTLRPALIKGDQIGRG